MLDHVSIYYTAGLVVVGDQVQVPTERQMPPHSVPVSVYILRLTMGAEEFRSAVCLCVHLLSDNGC